MGIVSDLETQTSHLRAARKPMEALWREIQGLAYPMAGVGAFDAGLMPNSYMPAGPRVQQATKKLVDPTGIWAVDRLSAGIESLVSPTSGEMWHDLDFNDPFGEEPIYDEALWLERTRNYMFKTRYNPRSGYRRANQIAIRSTVAFGHGIFMVEEWFSKSTVRLPIRYRSMPTSECFIGADAYGDVNVNHREYRLTAIQAAAFFGLDSLPGKLETAAESVKDQDKQFTFVHAVRPRDETGSSLGTNRDSDFGSYYYCREEPADLIRESGFFSFPYVVYQWSPISESAYCESPVMATVADLKALQVIATSEMRASQQLTDPPLALGAKGTGIQRPNLNSRALNWGALNYRGEYNVKPLITAQSPTFAQAIIASRRANIKESMLINLFTALIDNPSSTATEALLKDQQIAALLGPAGARLQDGQAKGIERELDILDRKGAFKEDSALRFPQTGRDPDIGAKFASPLDRLMQSSQLVGINRTIELAGALAQADPSVLDNLAPDETLRKAYRLMNAPIETLRPTDLVTQRREQRAQAEQVAQAAAMAEQVGRAANEGVTAAKGLQDLAAPQAG